MCVSGSSPFFFFQAEDGIRDGHVTGVQTCALPISLPEDAGAHPDHGGTGVDRDLQVPGHPHGQFGGRSEERRVGKECRSRGSGGRSKGGGRVSWGKREERQRTVIRASRVKVEYVVL